MKKLMITVLAIATLVIAPLSFANTSTEGFQIEKSAVKGIKAKMYPTDIMINNYAADSFYIMVPNSIVHAMIYPNSFFRVFHKYYYGDTHIILKDMYQKSFFDGYVCRHAMISVSGSRYNYNVNIDRSLC